MEARFCEATLDLHLILSPEDIEAVRESSEILSASYGDRRFWLWIDDASDYAGVVDVVVPEFDGRDYRDAWLIRVRGVACQKLVEFGEVGTRVLGSSKVKILREDYFEEYL